MMAYSDDEEETRRIILDLEGEANRQLEVLQTQIVNKDGSMISGPDIVRLGLGLVKLYVEALSEKKEGEDKYLAINTIKGGECTPTRIILPNLTIVRVIIDSPPT